MNGVYTANVHGSKTNMTLMWSPCIVFGKKHIQGVFLLIEFAVYPGPRETDNSEVFSEALG